DPYLRLTVLLDQARRDPALSGLVIKIDGLPDVGLGKAEELRQAILRFRASGKKVVAYLLSATDTDYLVASAADQIYAAPESMLLLDGFAANVTFFGQAMEKLGVHWDVARVGAYKNAPDALTRSGMSDEQRESLNAYLDASVKLVESAVAQARQVSPERLREAWAEALIPPRRAQALKLVDDVLSPFELQERLKTVVPKARFTGDYRPPRLKETRWGIRPRVAVVPVIGNIAGGKSRQDPLGLAEVAGAETIVRALGRAAADPTVKAIVLRVDSPGGSGLASDLIYRAVLDAKKHKPVVASMGDYAASGGYYVAMGADEVLATSASLTGSIGVFLVKPAFEKLGEKLGIRFESVDRGPLAHILNINRPWNDAERTAAQRWVDSFYDGFITEVAASRKLDKAKVDAVAKGRIWAGEDALRRGLVDRTGGLFDALQAAQGRAQVSEADDPEWVVFGDAQGFLGSMGGEDGVAAKLLGSGKPVEAPPLAHLTRELGVDASFLLEPGMKARLPFGVQVR
ncbi:MAG TPA: signal peptide peptidase SppA, partial [Myxococcaceae bacterium]|nr:signal peptide peptidase SppA [Myxococcaceae bacterium]